MIKLKLAQQENKPSLNINFLFGDKLKLSSCSKKEKIK